MKMVFREDFQCPDIFNGVLSISPAEIIRTLKVLPEDHLHCAILAVTTLYRAIADYLLQRGR